jgi:intergrase/recombinase
LRFFENRIISKPIEFRDISLKDKEERGLRNLLNYFEDEERDEICDYSLEKWRRFVKIKKSGVVEIYVNDGEIKKAFEEYPEEMKPIYRLLVYSGNRLTHIIKCSKTLMNVIEFRMVKLLITQLLFYQMVQKAHFTCFSLLPIFPN